MPHDGHVATRLLEPFCPGFAGVESKAALWGPRMTIMHKTPQVSPGTYMTIAYVGNNPPTAPGSGPAVFPVEDIHWAQAWAGVAPG
jgi:hypothetical protein